MMFSIWEPVLQNVLRLLTRISALRIEKAVDCKLTAASLIKLPLQVGSLVAFNSLSSISRCFHHLRCTFTHKPTHLHSFSFLELMSLLHFQSFSLTQRNQSHDFEVRGRKSSSVLPSYTLHLWSTLFRTSDERLAYIHLASTRLYLSVVCRS